MRRPGTYFLGTALAVGLGIAIWSVASKLTDPGDLLEAPPMTQTPAEIPAGLDGPILALEEVESSTQEPVRTEGTEASQEWVFSGPKGPFRLAVRVLDAATREPLESYLVIIALSGRKDFEGLPLAQRSMTSAAGECVWPELEAIGPWDVFVSPPGYHATLLGPDDMDRVASVLGERVVADGDGIGAPKPGLGKPLEVLVETGPRVTYRGPLPAGVQPKDLRFDLRGRINIYSSRSEDNGGPSRGRETPEGWVTAAIPAIRNSLTGPNFGVRIWTADGRFGHASVHPGKPDHSTRVVIEEPLRARARVRFRVELMGSDGDPPAARAREIAESVDWEVVGTDPERDALDLPASLRAGPWSREVLQVGPDTFEIGDLPPTTIAFRGWRDRARLEARVHAPEGVQAAAAHGEPSLTVIRLQPVR